MSRVLFSALICAVVVSSASADIPQVISYQGKVTDSGGIPVADGNYSMTFTIYDAETAGTSLWSSGTVTVTVSSGIFSVLLGESPLPTLDLDFDIDYWLEIDIAGDVQSPRTLMGSVGYAYMASGIVPGTEMVDSRSNPIFKGTNYGNGAGLRGDSDQGTGIRGQSSATDGKGVYGYAAAASGLNYGVYGETSSTDGFAGYFAGRARVTDDLTVTSGGNLGVGTSNPGARLDVRGSAVFNEAGDDNDFRIEGDTEENLFFVDSGTDRVGIRTESPTAALDVRGGHRGVYGYALATTGSSYAGRFEVASETGTAVYGEATATTGLTNTHGVYGVCASSFIGTGVSGIATATGGPTAGVYGLSASPDGQGVYGANSGAGYGVYSQGDFAASGSKSCVVKTSQGPTLMYCQESPENWFEDFGEGKLENGRCHIELDPLFLETVTIDDANPLKVFVEVEAEYSNGVSIKRGMTGFDVIERHGGTTSSPLWYRVVAKRRGFEDKRLDYCKAAETDSYLYPELREKELRRFDEERARMEEERRRMEDQRAARMMENDPTATSIPLSLH